MVSLKDIWKEGLMAAAMGTPKVDEKAHSKADLMGDH